jgi:hypothetical protein
LSENEVRRDKEHIYVNLYKAINMNSTIYKTFTASLTIGSIRGYSKKRISNPEFKVALLGTQQKIYESFNIGLSAKLSPCEILFLGQEEPSFELQFIQYPKFPHDESLLKKAIIKFTELMMITLDQNRVVIVFTDETVMLEQSEIIDPEIKL